MTVFGGNVLGKSVTVPGLGEFGYFSVGSILHSRGIEHFFQPEGAASRIDGTVRFSAYVDLDGDLKWKFDHAEGPNSRERAYDAPPLTEETQIDFPSEVVAEMRRLTETLHEREPGLWYHQVISAIDIEIKEFEKRKRNMSALSASSQDCSPIPNFPKAISPKRLPDHIPSGHSVPRPTRSVKNLVNSGARALLNANILSRSCAPTPPIASLSSPGSARP